MKSIIFMCLVGTSLGATISLTGQGPPYVWDLQKVRQDAAAVSALLSQKAEGQYPTYNGIPDTKFDCKSKTMPGYYADVDTQCQVYHRCDQNGNMTSYICDNTTVYDQVTLICDYWFNVDCSRTEELQYFANRRIYQTDLPLFDSPPADYVAPQSGGSSSSSSQKSGSSGSRPAAKGQKSGSSQQGSQVSAKANAKPGQSSAQSSANGKNAKASGKASLSLTSSGNSEGNANANARTNDLSASAEDSSDAQSA